MKKISLWAVIGALAVVLAAGFALNWKNAQAPAPPATGTQPPAGQGMVNGSVLLGPVCPVEHIPPLPGCAPRPYKTAVSVQRADSPVPLETVSTDASGTFSVTLAPGTYLLQAQGGPHGYPRCVSVRVQVTAGATQDTAINCDTGIR